MARRPRGGPSRYERDFFRDYLERIERADRMGIHDLSERYGRYSGGSPYSYEYTEQTIEHRRRGARGPIGFTRPLRPPRPRRRLWGRRGRPGRRWPGAWDYGR
ncbi:MAG TPA: hypothetical protein VF192_05685 [Longimicrobiales bacterium]